MLAQDVIRHLIAVLPQYTDLFSDVLTVDSISVAGSTITIEFDADHGLANGDQISIHCSTIENVIDNYVASGAGLTTLTTTDDHDLTFSYQPTVNLRDEDTQSIAEYTLTAVPNRKTFEVSATLTATSYTLLENREINTLNSLHSVTVINSTTVEITQANVSAEISADLICVSKNVRISGATNIERITESYKTQMKVNNTFVPWAFVVLNDVVIGKSRRVERDALQNQGALNDYNLEQMQNFSVFVFIPSDDKITGRDARDQAEILRAALYSALLGVQFPTGMSQATPISSVVPVDDGIIGYDLSFYMHQYSFQQVVQVAFEDTMIKSPTRAWRNIDLSWLNDFDSTIINDKSDLDDEPLP